MITDQFTRRVIGFAVHAGDVKGTTLCRMFNKVIAGRPPPRYLSSDNDPLFEYHRWLANLRVLEVDGIKAASSVPVSHPFVDRLIGTVRREYLEHILIWNTLDLERKHNEFKDYYNHKHGHASLVVETYQRKLLANPGRRLRRSMISNGSRITVSWPSFQSPHKRYFDTDTSEFSRSRSRCIIVAVWQLSLDHLFTGPHWRGIRLTACCM